MSTVANGPDDAAYPVDVHVDPAIEDRNQLTCAFRLILAIPHILLVGGPLAAGLFWGWTSGSGHVHYQWGSSGGVLGAVAGVVAIIAWFAILFTGRYPKGLWDLATFYLRWRVRAVAYCTLLRDEYPPFGDGPYPAGLDLEPPEAPRDRLSVAFRILLALPHLLVLWFLMIGWAFTSVVAWIAILFTARYPRALYDYGVGVLRWSTRLEAYVLLLRDEYPPFSLS